MEDSSSSRTNLFIYVLLTHYVKYVRCNVSNKLTRKRLAELDWIMNFRRFKFSDVSCALTPWDPVFSYIK